MFLWSLLHSSVSFTTIHYFLLPRGIKRGAQVQAGIVKTIFCYLRQTQTFGPCTKPFIETEVWNKFSSWDLYNINV